MADKMDNICWATTDNTSASIRLNSSKQAQAPEDANPLKNYLFNHSLLFWSLVNCCKCSYFAHSDIVETIGAIEYEALNS